VIVGEDGVVRLVDFELACDIGSTGEAAGTPGYCSPQQIAGAPAAVPDDIHGLGAVLYFLATGADPGAPNAGALERGLERVIARCLDSDPDARYPSMEELNSALAELGAPS
jgi:serine/threonine protein kinase